MALLLVAATAQAGPAPDVKCEAGKNDTAGKYAACMAKAEKRLVADNDQGKYDEAVAKCADEFGTKWQKLEDTADGKGVPCPSVGDRSPVQVFLDACQQSVADAVSGGTLGPDPITCATDLDTCSGSLGTCNGSLGTCTGSLGTCNTNLSTTNADLGACNVSLGTCSGSLGTCNGSLGTCNTNLSTTNADLGTCNGNLTTCNGSLGTCNTNLSTTNADLGTCNTNLGTCNSGSATAANVLAPETFSSSAGLGATGTMPNNGAVTITPGAAEQTIAAGYHNGSGTVAGDSDLAASNIVSGVNIFGVTGTASGGLPAQPLRSGQTTAYGTGSDGDLKKGVAQSFTDNGDGTITDTKTGLMWEKKSDDGSIHDKDNYYTWGMDGSPYTMNRTMVTTFLASLNTAPCFAGYCDWRIPNRPELLTLVNLETWSPATFTEFNTSCAAGCTVDGAGGTTKCSCTQSSLYWSSSTYQYNPGNAWGVNFGGGYTHYLDKTRSTYVRAVRAGS